MSPNGGALNASARNKAVDPVTASLSSMTGFARRDGALESRRWTWEVKSVNARGLEMRFRLPQGLEALEPDLRAAAKAALHRGSLNVSLAMRAESAEGRLRINDRALADALSMIRKVAAEIDCAPPRPEGVLALRGVVEPIEEAEDEEAQAALSAAFIKSFQETLGVLCDARRAEGAAMAKALSAQFDEIAQLTETAASLAAATPDAIRRKIETQLNELLAGGGVPEERLAQEAALLAVKADVREEIDRLRSHLEAARVLLAQDGPAGRQLDFLSQEFNREANTLCAKASDMELKRVGLDLKKVIDQMREQVQNIE